MMNLYATRHLFMYRLPLTFYPCAQVLHTFAPTSSLSVGLSNVRGFPPFCSPPQFNSFYTTFLRPYVF